MIRTTRCTLPASLVVGAAHARPGGEKARERIVLRGCAQPHQPARLPLLHPLPQCVMEVRRAALRELEPGHLVACHLYD